MKTDFTRADMQALESGDSNYLLNKGADYYRNEEYEKAAEYYHLAAAMGNTAAASNLGYCYMYGRHTDRDMSLAIAYFRLAAANGNIDALYKLGNIYATDKYVAQDTELSLYYYDRAIAAIAHNNANPLEYPSVFFSIGREHMPGGHLVTDIELAYNYLSLAEEGYELAIADGCGYYRDAYDKVCRLLRDNAFDSIRDGDDAVPVQ